jgi:hypothetical protein
MRQKSAGSDLLQDQAVQGLGIGGGKDLDTLLKT